MIADSKRTAIITGATRGLGLALARALAERDWSLVIDARSQLDLETVHQELSRRTRVIAVTGDVRAADHRLALARAASALLEPGQRLEAVINNASLLGPSPQPELLDYPLEVLEQVLQANLLAPLGVVQAVRPHLKDGSRIINISSDAAVQPYAGWGGYGASKAGLEQLSAILAAENPGWRVYWVDPGDMRTQMQQEAFPGEDISDRPLPEERVPGLLSLLEADLPSGRYQASELMAVRGS